MINNLEKKFLRTGRFPQPVHKRRPFSNVPESSEWFDNSEDGGENNEVFFCFIYFITSKYGNLYFLKY